MFALLAIVAVQLLFTMLLFGTLLLDRREDVPRMAELRRRVR